MSALQSAAAIGANPYIRTEGLQGGAFRAVSQTITDVTLSLLSEIGGS
jgi:hypothetical protein